jgi:hypothetical protein
LELLLEAHQVHLIVDATFAPANLTLKFPLDTPEKIQLRLPNALLRKLLQRWRNISNRENKPKKPRKLSKK